MTLHLLDSNAVVVARHFNPSIVSTHWLVRNQLMGEDDFGKGSLFSDMIVQVHSKQFVLLLSPDQLQFTPHATPARRQEVVCEWVGKFVGLLPETPYIAMGLNFIWQFEPEKATLKKLSRELFFVPDSPVYKAFAAPDARFGGYLSKDALGFRLKLDARPTVVRADGREVHSLILSFNYHLDLETKDKPVEQIRAALGRWNEARDQAEAIVHAVAERDKE